MTDPFTLLKNALAAAMGSTPDIAGYVLGAALTIALLIMLVWLLGDTLKGNLAIVIPAFIGVILSTLFGWFPPWVVIFMGLGLAFLLVNPFGGDGDGGE